MAVSPLYGFEGKWTMFKPGPNPPGEVAPGRYFFEVIKQYPDTFGTTYD